MREQERMAVSQDTEITLGAGKLLGLFFSLAILCGVSLGVGYWLGRNSMKQATDAASLAQPTAASAQAPAAAAKPGASQAAAQPADAKPADCTTGDNCPSQTAAPSGTDLTFYQAVQQKEEHPQLDTPPAQQPASSAAQAASAESKPQSTLGNGYVVQIAAVRNQDDARLLSDTLRKQQYPVLVSQPGDHLFHVQVGPYADIKEAEAIRTRLVSAGYNPYLKH